MAKIQYTIPASVTGKNEKNVIKEVKTFLGLWWWLRKSKKAKAKGLVVWF